MEMQLLTPTEIWEGFNPVKEGTETSIISSRENDNVVTTDVFFTSEKTESGRVRVFARISYDSRWRDARPAVLILPSLDASRRFEDVTESLVKEGYVVCLCDYAGNFGGTEDNPHTTYPEELAYAAAPACEKNMYRVVTTARETPWFQWAKVARRAITMIAELRYVDAERIGVIGMEAGAQIAWQVAGMDGRVRALVPVNGGGYLWRRNVSRFEGNTLPADDEERAFSAGVGAETYARFVSCPTCYIVSSNSVYTDIDRAGDILSLVPAKSKIMMTVRGSAEQVSVSVYNSLIAWMRKNFAHDSEPVMPPSVSFRADENTLYLQLKCPSSTVAVDAYYSTGEAVSFARYWVHLEDAQQVGENEYVYMVPVTDPDALTFAFASVRSDDGIIASSPVEAARPSELGMSRKKSLPAGGGRIVYSGEMGTGLFWVTTKDFFLDDSVLGTAKGPFGIKGIRTTKGNLMLCRSTQAEFACDKSAILQMDVSSETDRTITFAFLSYPDRITYHCTVNVKGGDFWQKVRIVAADCKSEEGRPLSKFGVCKLMTVTDAENVLFNNIVWI